MSAILIVEDERDLAQVLEDYLKHNQFTTHSIEDGARVMAAFQDFKPDLILLDLMLPNVDGLALCKRIRQQSNVPIIMMTAKVEEIDRLLGLELGADDYICKPYSPREVVARVKAVLRRTQPQATEQQQTQPTPPDSSTLIQLDEERLSVSINQNPLTLTLVEFRLLKTLMQARGRIFNREQLMDHIYDDRRVVNDRTIDSHITKLRKKLANAGCDAIRSVYGVGYKFELDD